MSSEKLWSYNLHYFDDLNARDAVARVEWHRNLLLRWVRENPPAVGIGWDPYPTSLRIVNWIKWALNGNELDPACVASLAIQVRLLSQRLEIHLLGNHLLANARALVFAGLFFEGTEPEGWLAKGLNILEKQLPEQILPDGGHIERSTMYHALVLEDILDLCNLTNAFTASVPSSRRPTIAGWRERVGLMRDWLAATCHPDGEISFFNDAAFGIAAPRTELERYAHAIGLGPRPQLDAELTHLKHSGYIRLERDNMVALLDVALIGPDYLPGHAHADTLSFELSILGQRVFVNSGVSCYGDSAERIRQRGTAAHTTLVLDGHNSSEIWGGFRVAKRARVLGPRILQENDMWSVEAGHDGYRHRYGRPIHWRSWKMGTRCLWVEDRVEGSGEHQVEILFYLHPDTRPSTPENGLAVIRTKSGAEICRVHLESPGRIEIEESTWHSEFGVSIPSFRLVFRTTQSLPVSCKLRIES